MKHLFLRLICLLLALCAAFPAALAEGDGPTLARGDYLQELFVRDDVLHAVTGQGYVYAQTDSGWEQRGQLPGDVRGIDLSNGDVWMLVRWDDMNDDRAGYRIKRAAFQPDGTLGEAEVCCDIAWDVLAEEWPSCYGFALEDGAAYVLMADAMDYRTRVLYRVDLGSGAGTKILSGPLSELRHYQDDLLLSRRFSWDDYVNGGQPQIVTIDPETGSMEVVGLMTGYADGALAYDPGTDGIYFSNSSMVYRAAGAAPEVVGYTIPSGMEHEGRPAAVLRDRYYVLEGSLLSAAIAPDQLPARTLRVAHEYDLESVVHDFAVLHPEIAIQYVDNLPSAPEELVLHMQSSAAADVYSYSVDSGFATMRDKKYMVDLSGDEALMAVVSRMDQRLIAPLYLDGRLCAVPYSLNLVTDGWYPGAFEKAGVPTELVPSSVEELLEFSVIWHDDYFEDNEDMQFYEYTPGLRNDLIMRIVSMQVLACQEAGETPSLNTLEVRALLTRVEEIGPIMEEIAPPLNDYVYSSDMANSALFTWDAQPMPHRWFMENAPQPMPLSLTTGKTPHLMASMNVLAVNPYSANADIAMELLAYIAQHLPEEQQIALMPDQNEPIAMYNEEDIARQQESIAQLTRQLEEAPEEEKAEAQWQFNMAKDSLDFMEQHHWVYTAEDIAYYREAIEPYVVYPLSAAFGAGGEQISSLTVRYMDGQLSLDEFIREFDRIIWMIENEQ